MTVMSRSLLCGRVPGPENAELSCPQKSSSQLCGRKGASPAYREAVKGLTLGLG